MINACVRSTISAWKTDEVWRTRRPTHVHEIQSRGYHAVIKRTGCAALAVHEINRSRLYFKVAHFTRQKWRDRHASVYN